MSLKPMPEPNPYLNAPLSLVEELPSTNHAHHKKSTDRK